MSGGGLFNSDKHESIESRRSIYNGRRSLVGRIVQPKLCIICKQSIVDEDYQEHVATCTVPEPEISLPNPPLPVIDEQLDPNDQSVDDSSTELKHTLSDSADQIPIDVDYIRHETATASIRQVNDFPDASDPSKQQSVDIDPELAATFNDQQVNVSGVSENTNESTTSYFRPIQSTEDVDEETDDAFVTPPLSPLTVGENQKKQCILCDDMIDEAEFSNHVQCCSGSPSVTTTTTDQSKTSSREHRFSSDDNDDDSVKNYELTCLPEEATVKTKLNCSICDCSVNPKDNLSRQIPCPLSHVYCLSCLRESMHECDRNRLAPVCHHALCDYQLSRHEISTIPLERRVSDQLLKLAKGQQRPQCRKCHFYIDTNEDEEFYDHVDMCQDLRQCHYCYWSYSTDQLVNHEEQCQGDKTSDTEKMIDFIVKRTKYPLTKEQISFFIQQNKTKSYISLDPLELIKDLAALGPTFPFDIPTKASELRNSNEEIEKTHDFIKCPTANCSWQTVKTNPRESAKIHCPQCDREFCSFCSESFHYQITCEELLQITEQWYLWCTKERIPYLKARAEKDSDYATILDEYDHQENANRNKELRQHLKDLIADEEFKIEHCRLCPSCQRYVQNWPGSGKIICGASISGDTRRSGCGTKFRWEKALPYPVQTTHQSIIDLPELEDPIVQHLGFKCDECGNDVNGIRFDCIHCPSLTFCEKCESQSTLEHFKKEQSHIFRLILTPDQMSIYL